MKIRAFLLAVCGIIMPALANAGETAFDFEVDGLRYEKTSESTVKVVGPGSDFRAGDLVIPAKIEADGNTYQVTAVGGTGFWGWAVSEKTPAITSVALPEGLEVIESGAFSFCSFSGKTLRLPSTLREIQAQAFDGSHLSGVVLPEGLEIIGERAFAQCGLKDVVIPSTVREIGGNPFAMSNLITSIRVADGNRNYDSREDCQAIIETATGKLISGCKTTEIPKGVRAIGDFAFESMGMTEITIPESVAEIGINGFTNGTLEDVYCYRPTPPVINARSVLATPYTRGVLHVPAGLAEVYRSVPEWSHFEKIVEMTQEGSLVDGIATPTTAQEAAPVYDLQGRKASSSPSHGIYIQNGHKFVVK